MPPATTGVDMDSDRLLDLAEAASLCGCPASTIEHLIELGLLPIDGPTVSDINGIRLMVSFEAAGISFETFAAAAAAGFLSLEFRRRLLPDPIGLSDRSFSDACRDLGLDTAVVARLLVTAGLPVPDADRVVRQDDLELLALLADGFALGVTEESAVRVLRVFGRSARLQAEAMRDLFRSDVEAATADQGLSPAAVMEVAASRRLPLQAIGYSLLDLLAKRNLEDVVFENVTMRIQDALSATGLAPARSNTDPAVAFIDVSGFSRMTREVGDDEAARRVARFEEVAQEVVTQWGGRIVKSLGDGLLTVFGGPADATGACLDLMDRLAAEGLPTIHAGLTVGPVVRRDGDIFGNSVNLAARLAGFAESSEIIGPWASLSAEERSTRQWVDGGVVAPKDLAPIRVGRLRRFR